VRLALPEVIAAAVNSRGIEGALRQYDGIDEFVVPRTYLIGVGTK
jgi:hypothetical protein